MASVFGSIGRGLYAAANAFLDELAHVQQSLGINGVAINFGPWQGGGMASQSALMSYESVETSDLDPKLALPVLERILESAEPQVVMVHIDWQKFMPVMNAKRRRLLLERFEDQGNAIVAKRPWKQLLESASEPAAKLEELISVEIRRILGCRSARRCRSIATCFKSAWTLLTWSEFVSTLSKNAGISGSLIVDGQSDGQRIGTAYPAIPGPIPITMPLWPT